MADDVAHRLHHRLAQAALHVDALQSEYDVLTQDSEVIQEDRDAVALLLEHARAELAAAEQAVERLVAGTYGRCARCGDPIAEERLAALVDVTTCVDCAS